MKKLFKTLLLSLVLVLPAFAVERSNTFFLLPSSIQEKIIIFEQTKPIKPRKIYITPDVYGIFHDYFVDTKLKNVGGININ